MQLPEHNGGVETEHSLAFGEAVKVWARIVFLSFGGPDGQIAL